MDKKKKQFVINTLRRASYRWPTRGQAEKRSRVERGVYRCEQCGHQGKRGEFAMDHVVPVVDPIKGFTTFDEYIERMLPDSPEQWQRLCKAKCHKEKTDQENLTRKETKKKRK